MAEKILLIDKDTELLNQIKPDLESAGFEIITASSAKQGLDKIRVEQPDFIVVELMLEKHDSGFELVKTVKADPVCKKTKVLMLSSAKEKTGVEFSQQEDGFWMKTDDFINKPVSSESLIKKIKQMVKN